MVVGSPIVLNLIPGGVMPVIMINETDKGYQKEFLIYNGNTPYNVPANVSATIRGTKRDGLGVTEAATVTAGSNVVRITVTEQMTAVPGMNIFELVFVDTNGLRVATINFIMLVERSALNANTVISESDIAYAEQVLTQLQGVEAYYNKFENEKITRFWTCVDMKASTSLKSGMVCQTAGYYAVNDSGAALYYVMGSAPVDDYYETLQNGLIAILITNTEVTPEQFGAHGNGTADDTQALSNAINYAKASGRKVQLSGKTYIIDSVDTLITLKDDENLIICGNGKSVLKRKDASVTADGQRLFRVEPDASNTKDIGLLLFKDFGIDSNLRGQTPPSSAYAYQHCADFRISGIQISKIKNVVIENVRCTDGVADHFLFAGTASAYVENVYISDFFVDYRSGTRSDICVTGWVDNVFCSNSKMVVFEIEHNSQNPTATNLFMNNVALERIDISGNLNCRISDIITSVDALFARISGVISDCSFGVKSGHILYLNGLTFSKCVFTMSVNSGDRKKLYLEKTNNVSFIGCTFQKTAYVDDDVEYYIFTDVQSASSYIVIDGCTFNENKNRWMTVQRTSGTLEIKNMTIKGVIVLYGNASYPIHIILSDLVFEGTPALYISSIASCTLEMIHVLCKDLTASKVIRDNSGSFTNATLIGHRTILIDAPLTKSMLENSGLTAAFEGDTYYYPHFLKNNVNRWIRTKTNGYSTTHFDDDVVSECTNGRGTTAERPDTTLLAAGYQYYDTDLNKVILWTGSAWRNLDGSAL